jgi:hypothetical protein
MATEDLAGTQWLGWHGRGWIAVSAVLSLDSAPERQALLVRRPLGRPDRQRQPRGTASDSHDSLRA